MKKLLVLVVLAVAGYAGYAYVVRRPEKRACMRLAELCGLDTGGEQTLRCSEMLVTLKKSNAEGVARLATCVGDAKSCGEAAGCASGVMLSAGASFARDFLNGLQKTTR
jgi:hypothetical protein